MSDVGKLTGDTGVLASGGSVTYEVLRELLDKDEKVERDILIGYNNSIAVIADLKSMKVKWSVLHWVPQAKPGGIRRNNPSDIVIELNSIANNKIQIDIIDSGKGIPRKDRSNVFKPGFSSKKRGWGLGLSLTKRIIEELHQG